MSNEKAEGSPFAALTYQEQQEKWREWRSRQTEYRAAEPFDAPERKDGQQKTAPAPERVPVRRDAAVRHQQLDAVLNRHAQALKHAGAFTRPSDMSEPPK